MQLPNEAFDAYAAELDPNQLEAVRVLRNLMKECEPGLDESVDTGKWWGGLLVYGNKVVGPLYALGPRSGGRSTFHMTPLYCSKPHQERHGDALKKFATGKSCITFTDVNELPLDALRDICTGGSAHFQKAMEERDAARKPKKKTAS
jgi:hypothetical protein